MKDLTLLGIESSGKAASAAVYKDGIFLSSETVCTALTHSQTLIPMCERAISNAGVSFDDISGIAVSAGPGSYTGLRIGIAAAKGMCLKGKIPVTGVSTLIAMAYNLLPFEGHIFSVMKARENIAYFAAYMSDGTRLKTVYEDCVVNITEIKDFENNLNTKIMLVGDWAEYIKDKLFSNVSTVFVAPVDKRLQDAKGVLLAALEQNNFISAEKLNARYLQITKAEKDRLNI